MMKSKIWSWLALFSILLSGCRNTTVSTANEIKDIRLDSGELSIVIQSIDVQLDAGFFQHLPDRKVRQERVYLTRFSIVENAGKIATTLRDQQLLRVGATASDGDFFFISGAKPVILQMGPDGARLYDIGSKEWRAVALASGGSGRDMTAIRSIDRTRSFFLYERLLKVDSSNAALVEAERALTVGRSEQLSRSCSFISQRGDEVFFQPGCLAGTIHLIDRDGHHEQMDPPVKAFIKGAERVDGEILVVLWSGKETFVWEVKSGRLLTSPHGGFRGWDPARGQILFADKVDPAQGSCEFTVWFFREGRESIGHLIWPELLKASKASSEEDRKR